jgi:ribosomal protein L10
MYRSEKIRFGERVAASATQYGAVAVCSCKAITANELTSFRLAIRRAGGYVQMGGNLIICKSLEGTKFSDITPHLTGNNLIVFFDSIASVGAVVRTIESTIKEHKERMDLKYLRIEDQVCARDLVKLLGQFDTGVHAVLSLLRALANPFQSLAILSKEYYDLKGEEGQQS